MSDSTEKQSNPTHIIIAVILSGGISGFGVDQFHGTTDELQFCSEYIKHNERHLNVECELRILRKIDQDIIACKQ